MKLGAMSGHDGSLVDTTTADAAWPDGFIDLYASRWAAMVRLARLLTAADGASEELVQDAFLRVRTKWGTLENPSAYVRAAVVNACRNHQRRRLLERRQPQSPGITTDAPDELRSAIARLPSRQRAALVLRYYEDLPEAEIAELLGCSVPAVKSLLHRAVNDLRKVIER